MSTEFTRLRHAYPVSCSELPQKTLREGRYEVRFARTGEELDQVQRLRFEIFNLELGEGLEASYATGRDEDVFDAVCHHLIVSELDSGNVVGSYRVQTLAMANQYRGFYSDLEFDLSGLGSEVLAEGVELGRACVAKAHRNTQVLFLLWKGLALYVAGNHKRYLFGCSSLTSQDSDRGWALMRCLEREGHLHPTLRVLPRSGWACSEPRDPDSSFERAQLPKLFRIYLRYGAKVCSSPVIDREFGTIDFLTLFDVHEMPRRMFRTFFDA